jgi:hypothetical protein
LGTDQAACARDFRGARAEGGFADLPRPLWAAQVRKQHGWLVVVQFLFDSEFLLFELLDRRKVGHGSGHFLLKLLIKTGVLELEGTDMRRFHWRYSFAFVQYERRSDR